MAKSTTKGRKRVLFTVQAPVGSEVALAGFFNDWNPHKKKLVDKEGNGIFTGVSLLPKGKHEYKFIINDEWCVDSQNPNFVVNDLGCMNSVLEVE